MRSGQLSPVSGLIPLPQLQTVEPFFWVNLPAIQAHHQNIVEQLVTPYSAGIEQSLVDHLLLLKMFLDKIHNLIHPAQGSYYDCNF